MLICLFPLPYLSIPSHNSVFSPVAFSLFNPKYFFLWRDEPIWWCLPHTYDCINISREGKFSEPPTSIAYSEAPNPFFRVCWVIFFCKKLHSVQWFWNIQRNIRNRPVQSTPSHQSGQLLRQDKGRNRCCKLFRHWLNDGRTFSH